ncbi:PREDICTED: putative clathrin assembly protein At5g65370 [Camelina sativa]|uniref:Clathrin assembly protein At5g65370 n=1 Tax=Camelina sativa TaxID=90675 RepID=A0ABM0UQF9_CAMSA|nr:PREDICTED: putative clathrin assembly protein At5g65370 [Camelina sativa]
MGILTTLGGKLKDEASQMKLNVVHLCGSENAKTINEAILKATSHTSQNPPSDKHVTFLQSTADTCYGPDTIAAILQRLRLTTDVCVAAKCLILLHKMIKSEYVYNGEDSVRDRNNKSHRTLIYNQGGSKLKLNDLNVGSSRFTRELSPWVCWYKQYLVCYFTIAEALGVTPNIKDRSEDKRLETHRVSSYTTDCIFKQVDFLVDLFEHISDRPIAPKSKLNKIVVEMIELMVQDYFSVIRLMKIWFEELNERVAKPYELVPVLERLEMCKEGLREFSWRCKYLVEDFWCLVSKLKDMQRL